MIVDSIALSEFEVFSKIDRDLNKKDTPLLDFLRWSPELNTFSKIISARSSFPIDRKVLFDVLKEQYSSIPHTKDTDVCIEQILSEKTFTVCTAHQPSLFGGPAFVLSKALSTIKLARQIQISNPENRIIPVFVIGAEDHDIDELNHTFIRDQKIVWNTNQEGPVGRFDLDGIQTCLHEYQSLFGATENDQYLKSLIQAAYTSTKNFGEAFQYLLIQLLDKYGLLVINMDHVALKQKLAPVILNELQHFAAKPWVVQTQEKLGRLGYEEASHARDINVFYFDKGYRERIEKEDGHFHIVGTDKKFTETEFINHAIAHPERFSPNVILRPLYQEIILPNLAYVGGGGELAYWLERKAMFEAFNVSFPMLVRRDSFMIVHDEEIEALNQYHLRISDLDTRTDVLMNNLAERLSTSELDLKLEENELLHWMDKIKEKAAHLDPTLAPTVEGEKAKLSKSIEYIEKKMLKAEKQKLEIKLNRAKKLKERLMPDGGLQERKENFSTFYAEYGEKFFDTLLQDFNPLDYTFKMIKIKMR